MKNINIETVQRERLILRKFTENDIGALFAIYGDEKTNIFLPWFPIKTFEEAESLFQEKYANPDEYSYAVCLKTDNIPIGYVHTSGDDSHDFGYGLRSEFWGRGIMTEACRAVINKLKNDGFEYITATHDVKNFRSGAVMKKLSMRYCYSYEEQWQPKNIPVIFRMYQLNFEAGNGWVYKKYWDESKNHFIETDI